MSKRKAGPALARGASQKRSKPQTGHPHAIEWRGYGKEEHGFEPSDVVYFSQVSRNLTKNIKLARQWPSRDEAVKWAKAHYRDRPFGNPSWKEWLRFVKVQP